jgi:hypothetical protein
VGTCGPSDALARTTKDRYTLETYNNMPSIIRSIGMTYCYAFSSDLYWTVLFMDVICTGKHHHC